MPFTEYEPRLLRLGNEAIGDFVANLIFALTLRVNARLAANPGGRDLCVPILMTGETPVPIYAAMVALIKERGLNLGDLWRESFNLDEYIGVAPDHEQAYRHFMEKHLFGSLGFCGGQFPDAISTGKTDDTEICVHYDVMMAAIGYPDIALLGIGTDGHIGFHMPGVKFDLGTHVAHLSQATIEANAGKYFGGDTNAVPKTARTMGISTINQTRDVIVLVATGEDKAEPVARSLTQPLGLDSPASALRRHPRVLYIVDEAAGSELNGYGGEIAKASPTEIADLMMSL